MIQITNATHHNLKGISINIPKNKLIVITGPSGSGKSTLAIDTLYAEGQRRYLESLSSYARQFLNQHQPPEVESIEGLSPSIAIDQSSQNNSPRSSVGTVTEISNFLKVLFARVGTLKCPSSGHPIRSYSPTQVVEILAKNADRTKIELLSPISCSSYSDVQRLLSQGFSRAYIDSTLLYLDELVARSYPLSMDLIVDRVVLKESIQTRLMESVECCYSLSSGFVTALINGKPSRFSEHNLSLETGVTYPKLEPNLFSPNSARGACPNCDGLGITKLFSESKILPDKSLSIENGAFAPFRNRKSFFYKMFLNVLEAEKISQKDPISKISSSKVGLLLNGSSKEYKYSFTSSSSKFEFTGRYEGIIPWLEKKYFKTNSIQKRSELEYLMHIEKCSSCDGQRLSEVGRNTFIKSHTYSQLSSMPLKSLFSFFSELSFEDSRSIPAKKITAQILNRLKCLLDLGLGYLSLDRPANTLSGGESQRIKLATQLGSALSGVLYILDEPSIGLHARDNQKLLSVLTHLKDLGNSVLVVEHDREAMSICDQIIDMGPGAGVNGGNVVFQGSYSELLDHSKSLTGKFLSNPSLIPIPDRKGWSQTIDIFGATKNNVANLDVSIPKGVLTCVTGVSGSGKSTLINYVLANACRLILNSSIRSAKDISNVRAITGLDDFKKVIILDQSPIGKSSKSNPATFSGIFDEIRSIFANVHDSKVRGFKAGRFSFNVKGGRCEECEGHGEKKVSLQFLPDVFVLCDSCKGKRYNSDTLNILYKGYSISDILSLTIEDAVEVFKNYPKIYRVLTTICSLGLGYLLLGQPAPTLSGGESQRLKLAAELAKKTSGKTLYLLDEPTTGLHFYDIKLLVNALIALRNDDNSVVVIEHNLDVIKCADHIIDMGPEGGVEGGKVIAQGSPEEVAQNSASHTGHFLKELL